MPLIMMIEAAQAGNEREVEECAKLFTDHAAKLEEVSFRDLAKVYILCICCGSIFYPWFKFYFSLFPTHYHTLPYITIHYHTLPCITMHYHTLSYITIHYHTLPDPKTNKMKYEPRWKLNHNIHVSLVTKETL